MAVDKSNSASGSPSGSTSDRTKKAAATRARTAEKVGRLNGENHYAYVKLGLLRSALESMQFRILDGGKADADLVEACGELDKKIGRAMFNA